MQTTTKRPTPCTSACRLESSNAAPFGWRTIFSLDLASGEQPIGIEALGASHLFKGPEPPQVEFKHLLPQVAAVNSTSHTQNQGQPPALPQENFGWQHGTGHFSEIRHPPNSDHSTFLL